MNSIQEAAFIGANSGNSSFEPSDLSFLIHGLLVAVVLLWFVWVITNGYKAWGGKKLTGQKGLFVLFRALFILIITTAIIVI